MKKDVMFSRTKALVLSFGMGVVALLPSVTAAAQTTGAEQPQPAKKVKKTSKVKKAKQAEAEPRLPGGETRAERERRLLRECKGRPNAGACSGYAS